MPRLSIIVPVYNEERTIQEALKCLISLPLDKEIIVVNDGSTDSTGEKINNFAPAVKILRHEKNRGKGAAIKTGLVSAQGEYIIFCDADLEYDINQIPMLFNQISRSDLAVVYGSRFIKYQPKKNRIHYLGNCFLTWLTNSLFTSSLTDMETAYKIFRADIIKNLNLTSQRFEIEPEITAKIIKQGIRILEVPAAYNPRVKSEGKKIKYRDGLTAVKVLIREKISRG